MGLFKKEKTRAELKDPPTIQGGEKPPNQLNHSFNDSTYYSSSNASTADSRLTQNPQNHNQSSNQHQNQSQLLNQPRGTTITTTTTTTTSKFETKIEPLSFKARY